MTFAKLVEQLAGAEGITKVKAKRMAEYLFAFIGLEVTAGRKVRIPKFGIFSRRSRKTRAIVSPSTKQMMVLPRQLTVGFRASKNLKRWGAW